MNQLRRTFADDVHTEQRPRLPVEQDLQTPRGVAADLPARDLAVIREPDFVGHVLVGQLLLGAPDERDFRDRVDPVRIRARVGAQLETERVGGRQPALFHGDGRQAREPDHVPGRVDVRLRRPVLRVHRDAATLVGRQARRLQVELIDVADASHRVEQRVAGNALVALERGNDGTLGRGGDRVDLLVEAQCHAVIPQVIAEGLHDFAVGELEQPRPLLDEHYADAERREHAGVFDADHAAADDDERLRQVRHLHHLVAQEDRAAVDRHGGRLCRARARGDDERVAWQSSSPAELVTRMVWGSTNAAVP